MPHRPDGACAAARAIIQDVQQGLAPAPCVRAFFDETTCTVSYVVYDPDTKQCAVLDSVLDFDPASGSTATVAAQALVDTIRAQDLEVVWLLETHAHADHLSAAPYLQEQLGGRLAIGQEIQRVQHAFGKIFNEGSRFARDGSQFDHLFTDGERFSIGHVQAIALHVPGHTPACLAYVIGDAVFVGDTLFMPDYGTARCDFPGGDARQLYRSIRRLMQLPDDARLFLCHDYKAPGRDHYAWETTIGAQRQGNVHVHEGISEDAFVAMRIQRDATLAVPKLLLPAVQVNMRGGHLPPEENNGVHYLKIPINVFGAGAKSRA